MILERDKSQPILSIVIPCYNEEEVLEDTMKELSVHLLQLINDKCISEKSFLLFVDDGSKDRTWEIIKKQSQVNTCITGLKLTCNVGHQNALLAGLMNVVDRSDCAISIDADLQDDPVVMKEFIQKYKEGYEIVYGVRQSREKDTFFKRQTARTFYRLMIKMGVNIVYDHADFRLMSNRALKSLQEFKEVNLFLRGLVPLIGFNSTEVYYRRQERLAGESKYPLKKMLAFSLDGITSFSITPIRSIMLIGITFACVSFLAGAYVLVHHLTGNTVTGWSSIVLSVWFIGGVQLMSIGLIGEYIGKIYKESKHRPRYFIEEQIHHKYQKQSTQKDSA